MQASARRLIHAALVVCLAPMSATAQTRPDACTAAATGPTDVSLRLSLKSSPAIFREGEIVPITLAFTSTTANTYYANTRNYDRSGRLNEETFCLEPAAPADPLADYYGSGLYGFIGGGMGSDRVLTTSPYSVDLELNEWMRLPPGRYRLHVVSPRVVRATRSGEPGFGPTTVPLWSNPIEFDVIPADAAWQAQQVAAATAALDGASSEAARHGARVLRFLGSMEAARELARRFWGLNDQPFGRDLMFGLVASPFRSVVIAAMMSAIAEPSHPISSEFIDTLALLDVQSNAAYTLPPYEAADKDAWTAARDRKVAAYHAAIARYLNELNAAVPAKTGAARAASVETLLARPPESTTDRTALRQMLAATWDTLPLRTRNELIQSRWNEIGGPELVPVLRSVVDTPRTAARMADRPDRESALARLYELSPAEGRARIVDEMIRGTGDVGMATLGLLPDQELPEIEAPLLAKIQSATHSSVDYQVLARYASASVLPEIRRLYERQRGRWACAPQTAMLQYFLRADQPYGVSEVTAALAQRQFTGCYSSLFTDLKEASRIPEVERLAIAALDDPAPTVVGNAAAALMRYGAADAEGPLWRRLQRFHDEWKDRWDELRPTPGTTASHAAEGMAEFGLINAIVRGDGWTAGPEALTRLKALVSPQRQTEVDMQLATWSRGPLSLSLTWAAPDGALTYSVAAYHGQGLDALTRKLQQFPAGTGVVCSLTAQAQDEHRADLDAILRAARAAGVSVTIEDITPSATATVKSSRRLAVFYQDAAKARPLPDTPARAAGGRGLTSPEGS
jgi:hypothetical protein